MRPIRTRRRPAAPGLAAVALVAATALSACSSTTDGLGHEPGTHAASRPDFPTSGAGGTPPSPTAVGTPSIATGTPPPTVPSTPAPSTTVITPPDHPVKTVTVHGTDGDFRVEIWVVRSGADCAAHAYGKPVIAYLTAHPCTHMTRILATTTVDGRAVGFAREQVTFGGSYPQMYTYAGKFRALVTKDGTGNVNDLTREGYRLPRGPAKVPYPNAFDAQSQDAVVAVTEAWYLSGPTPDNDPALVRMEQDCFLQV